MGLGVVTLGAGTGRTGAARGGLGVISRTARLRLMILVSSFLKVSRSICAADWGAVKVKL